MRRNACARKTNKDVLGYIFCMTSKSQGCKCGQCELSRINHWCEGSNISWLSLDFLSCWCCAALAARTPY